MAARPVGAGAGVDGERRAGRVLEIDRLVLESIWAEVAVAYFGEKFLSP